MFLKRLKELREEKSLKQVYIAEILEMKREQYSRYETGKRDIPLDCLIRLADLYNTSTDYLLERTNNKEFIKQ